MEIFRPLIGFVLGLAVTIGAYVGGFLDNIPHWSRSHAHWAGGTTNTDPDHVRYKVSAEYQPGDGGSDDESCPPQFEFHNRTNRNVVFSSDGYDDLYRGSSNSSSKISSDQDTISMTPDQGDYGPPAKSGGKDPYDSQDYGSQDYGSSDNGGSEYGSENAGYNQNYGGGQYDSYDDEYPGPSGGDACSAGVVDIFLDRKN